MFTSTGGTTIELSKTEPCPYESASGSSLSMSLDVQELGLTSA